VELYLQKLTLLAMKTTSVLLTITEPLTIKALTSVLQTQNYAVRLCDEMTQIATCIVQNQPDVVFASTWTAEFKQQHPNTEFILFKSTIDTDETLQVLGAGFNGCLLHRDPPDEILKCVEKVSSGTPYLSSYIRQELVAKIPANFERATPLTTCETEIMKLVARHFSSKEMADHLKISLWTVQDHRRNIKQKLNLPGGKHILEQYALCYALKQYLPPLPST
jgi:DNA-binding NarL/FixJ family response regulator